MTDPTPTPAVAGPPPSEPTFSPPVKRSWLRQHWLLIAGFVLVFVVGALIGGAGKSPATAEPLPAETITVTETVENAVDDGCKAVALELYEIMASNHSEVTEPLLAVNELMYDYIVGDGGLSAIEEATGLLDGTSSAMSVNTGRLEAISPAYTACVN